MKERFEEKGCCIETLKKQEIVCGDDNLAITLLQKGELLEFQKGDEIIKEDNEDNDIYFLLSGATSILVKGNQIAERKAGQHIGEMSAIEPSQKRAATVNAIETVVALRLSSTDFMSICVENRHLLKHLAQELAKRLYQRNKLILPPNESPKLFIISSTEALDVAQRIKAGLEPDVNCTVWNEGVFFAGGFTLEALEQAITDSDFAVAVAHPDDILEYRGKETKTIRDNVIFELGLFMGKLTRYRAILLCPRVSDLKIPTDLQGLTNILYDPPEKKEDLAERLNSACNDIREIINRLGVRKSIS